MTVREETKLRSVNSCLCCVFTAAAQTAARIGHALFCSETRGSPYQQGSHQSAWTLLIFMPPRLSPCHTTPGPHTEQRRAIPNFQVPVASPGRSGLASCHTPPHHHMPSLRAHDTEHNPPAKRSFPLYYI